MTTPDRNETAQQNDYRTIAVMQFSDRHYLVRENPAANIKLDFIDPQHDVLKYHKETKTLPQNNIFTFAQVEAPRMTIAQVGMPAPQVRWGERTSAVDEPTILYPATNAIKGGNVTIEMYEPELHDLFLPKQGKERKASFTTMNTTSHELTGVTLKRPSSVLMLLTPGKDGLSYSSQIGLKIFVDNIYQKLTEHLTTFQTQVDRAAFAAIGPGGAVEFTFDASTPAKQRQREIQQRIYQIQALLLAGNAEKSETFLQDPDLLAHAPYLAPAQPKQSGGFLDRIFGGNDQDQQRPTIKVGNKIWENLVSIPSGDLLRDPQAEAARRTASNAATHTTAPRSAPQPATPVYERPAPTPTPTRPIRPVSQAPEPARRSEPRPLTEKEQAVKLAKELEIGLSEAIRLFQNKDISELRPQDAVVFNTHVNQLAKAAKRYMSQRGRGKLSEKPIESKISVKPGNLTITGIKDKHVFEFLTGDVEGDYKAKIDSVFIAWGTYVRPLYVNLGSVSARKYPALKDNTTFRQENPAVFKKIFIETEKVLNSLAKPPVNKDIQTEVVAYILLGEQIIYSLSEQLQQIKTGGQAVEIDNWASYCSSTLTRLKDLIPQAIEARKRKN